ncbi:MAG: hypothetical protein Q8Q33_09645, partial [Chlamydiota bacterium]|nr:hypothetical protein [Chlamydiota bacterium]
PYSEDVAQLIRKLLYNSNIGVFPDITIAVLTEPVDMEMAELEYPEINVNEKIMNLLQGVIYAHD